MLDIYDGLYLCWSARNKFKQIYENMYKTNLCKYIYIYITGMYNFISKKCRSILSSFFEIISVIIYDLRKEKCLSGIPQKNLISYSQSFQSLGNSNSKPSS